MVLTRHSHCIVLITLLFFACSESTDVETNKQICEPNDRQCAREDADGDGVINSEDDFPSDATCAERNQDHCSACGVGCQEQQICSEEGECVINLETCDGIDNDADGSIDEQLDSRAPESTYQDGICAGAKQVCENGAWLDPPLDSIEGYERAESVCDGIDSDCDGATDEELEAPLDEAQTGVCAGSVKQCLGQEGWGSTDPDQMDGYESNESSCDGLDNDCDGEIDEASVQIDAPLAEIQNGVCSGSRQVCDNGVWSNPPRSTIEGYESTLSSAE